MRWWITIGWRWFIRLAVLGILAPCILIQGVWGIPTWDYLWTHYLWEPYVPFMVGFIILFLSTFVPFGKQQRGGDYPNE